MPDVFLDEFIVPNSICNVLGTTSVCSDASDSSDSSATTPSDHPSPLLLFRDASSASCDDGTSRERGGERGDNTTHPLFPDAQ